MATTTVQLNDQATALLRRLAAQRQGHGDPDASEGDILARAIAFYNYAYQNAEPAGKPTATLMMPNGAKDEVTL